LKNAKNIYSLSGDRPIVKTEGEEKDLGIIVAQTLKFSSQYVAGAKSANKTLGVINRIFVNKDKEFQFYFNFISISIVCMNVLIVCV